VTAKEIIERVIYLTVATASKEGELWNTPVYDAGEVSGTYVDVRSEVILP